MQAGAESFDLLAKAGCAGCREPFAMDLTMAFQPIVDIESGAVFAYEALVRGLNGESAGHVLAQVTPENRFAFDQLCRRRAVEHAARLGVTSRVSINFMPNAVYQPALCLGTTLAAARRAAFPIERIMFEVTEGERIEDRPHLVKILNEYKRQGFATAIDDFGAGHSGLTLLAEFQPDIVKLDMDLIRDIDSHRVRQEIVASMLRLLRALGVSVIAEGIETEAEFACLRKLGVTLMQGYLFARPALETLPDVSIPSPAVRRRSRAA